MFGKPKYSGVADLGTEKQKKDLYPSKELVASPSSVSLSPTNPDRWKIWPKRNQDGQSSCVYHARGKAGGILHEIKRGEFVELTAADYENRSNKPAEGSFPVESFDMWRNNGIGLEVLEPSNNLSAEELRAHKQTTFEKNVAQLSLLDAYYAIPAFNFDMIVSTLHATQKPIPLGFFATYEEWNKDTPVIRDPGLSLQNAAVRHEVCATPNFGIFEGQEGFTIEDSWGDAGIAGTGVRWISRSFCNARNYIPGLVPTSFKDFEDIGVEPSKPKSKLRRDLEREDTGDDVHRLQMVLKYEGFFPANHSGSTYFGPITERAVKMYQEAYDIVNEGTPQTTGYGRVGPQTRAHINNRYR